MVTDVTGRQLAARIQQEREAREWTLAELADHSGVSRAMLSKVEREEASLTAALLGRISAAFGLTLAQLFPRAEGTSFKREQARGPATSSRNSGKRFGETTPASPLTEQSSSATNSSTTSNTELPKMSRDARRRRLAVTSRARGLAHRGGFSGRGART